MIQQERLKNISYFLYFGGLLLLAVSIPLSKFTISISQFMLAAGWLLGGDFKNKLNRFISSKLALVLVSIYLMHLVGLIYTTDFDYALKDLRIKIPLLILPLLLFTSQPLKQHEFEKILLAVLGGVVISTGISFLIYLGIVQREVNDIRDICIFISHIRLALMCCVSIFICSWFFHRYRNNKNYRIVYLLIPITIWLIYFIFLIQSLTGVLILVVAVLIALFYLLIKRNTVSSWLLTISVLAAITFSVYQKINSINETFRIKESVENVDVNLLTPSGNKYHNYFDREEYENGYPVWSYLCEDEMKSEWNKRSVINYDSIDSREQRINVTLIRFLSSKGLKKDSVSVWSLSSDEIEAIEKGIANCIYIEGNSMDARIHQVYWEFNNKQSGGNPSGHSIIQRLEYWKASIGIISEHPFFGVGTGDIVKAFETQYENNDSVLSHEWRLRSHNQYLSIAATFGLVGLAWFLIALIYPIVISVRKRDFLYLSFALVASISMITEDTLESQAGVTFFVFFTCLYLFVNPQNRSFDGNPPNSAGGRH